MEVLAQSYILIHLREICTNLSIVTKIEYINVDETPNGQMELVNQGKKRKKNTQLTKVGLYN